MSTWNAFEKSISEVNKCFQMVNISEIIFFHLKLLWLELSADLDDVSDDLACDSDVLSSEAAG